jgi:CheY-like chemotaxis protein
MQILVVEDDAVLAMVSALALEEAGHAIVGVVHDIEGFQQLPELNGTDLALVDINLAGANEGLEVARKLHENKIPVLFISGQLNAARDNTHLALGLLRKPYEIEDLLDSVKYAHSFSSGSDPSARHPSALEIFESNENV